MTGLRVMGREHGPGTVAEYVRVAEIMVALVMLVVPVMIVTELEMGGGTVVVVAMV